MGQFDSIKSDLQAFADEENDIIIEPNGDILINRLGNELNFTVFYDEYNNLMVRYENIEFPYRLFLSKKLASLDVFAQKILDKFPPIDNYINGPAAIESVTQGEIIGQSLDLLKSACDDTLFCTKVVFVTADAGHGKTVLLRMYQNIVASKFLSGKSKYLFWHIDLQGRQLLRLNEALMGSLGELRMAGIYMQSIIALLKHGLLILAIDGFDELAAEQGSSDALGALSHLVGKLNDAGTIVAASRRTFFDAEEYTKRTRMLSSAVSKRSQYDHIKLSAWKKENILKFFSQYRLDSKKFEDPKRLYDKILIELNNNPNHPMITRPFLINQMAKGLLRYNEDPSSFIRSMTNPLDGVASVVEAFINREVTEKWKLRETGEPLLTQDQHMQLLSTVAEEMWFAQKERIRFDFIQEILTILMDDWKIETKNQSQIVEMVKMHVLLIPDVSDYNYRRFEHPEFKNYFLSQSLNKILLPLGKGKSKVECKRFLSLGQLPDSVAKYTASIIGKNPEYLTPIIVELVGLVQKEWRPTYLQSNVGTIIPSLINRVPFENTVKIDANIIFTSLVLEDTNLQNIHLEGCKFINVKLKNIYWENVEFVNCEFQDIVIDVDSVINNIRISGCIFSSVIVSKDGEEYSREYSPQRIVNILSDIGFIFVDEKAQALDLFDKSVEKKLILKFFHVFRRTTLITDRIIKTKFQPEQEQFVFDKIIPIAEDNGIIQKVVWAGGGAAQSWMIKVRVEDLFRGQDLYKKDNIGNFWNTIKEAVLKENE